MKKIIRFAGMFLFVICLALGVKTASFAETVRPTDVTAATEGYVLLGVRGTYSSPSKDEIMNRINAIRLEACKEGVLNPETGEPLTMNDYVPMKWSSDLEWIAQIRAAEATVNEAHVRPNGDWCFSLQHNGVELYGENLAWNYSGMMAGIEQWYDEKEDYVKRNDAVTGHYESLISPDFNYIGLGAFQPSAGGWWGIAAEFTYGYELDETKSTQMGTVIQAIEMKRSAVSAPIINGASSLTLGDSKTLTLIFNITYPGIRGGDKTIEGVPLGAVSWSSSNPQVASVDSAGNVRANAVGQATITAASSDGYTASCNVNVTVPVKGTKLSDGKAIYKVTKESSSVEYVKMTNKATTVVIPETVTIGGIKYKVTSIANNAFKNNKTIKQVTIGSNVTQIGKNAFYGCKKLKKIIIKTKKLKTGTVKSNAFKGIHSKATIKVPSKKLKLYKSILTKRGAGKKVKIKK